MKRILIALVTLAAGIYLLARWQASPPVATTTVAAVGQPLAVVAVHPDSQASGDPSAPAQARTGQLVLEIERSLVAVDPQQRETAFAYLLPELLHDDPGRVVQMVASQEPGEPRDALRNEVTRQWITQDRDAAVTWLKSFENATERRDSAAVAVRTLAAKSPPDAIAVADQFGIGRDDGSLAHIFQIWQAEDPAAAKRWLESQPPEKRLHP